MQANVHTPERIEGESMSAYRARRDESRRLGRLVRYVRPSSNPHKQWARQAKREIGPRQFRIARKAAARAAS